MIGLLSLLVVLPLVAIPVILVISQDLDELLEISDRLAVLHHGVLGDARPIHEWTVEALGLAMTGGTVTEHVA